MDLNETTSNTVIINIYNKFFHSFLSQIVIISHNCFLLQTDYIPPTIKLPHNIPSLAKNAFFHSTPFALYDMLKNAKATPPLNTRYSFLYENISHRSMAANKLKKLKESISLRNCAIALKSEKFWDLFYELKKKFKHDGGRYHLYLLIGNII